MPTLKGSRSVSRPNITLVIRNLVSLQQHYEFFFEGLLLIPFLLMGNVLLERFRLPLANLTPSGSAFGASTVRGRCPRLLYKSPAGIRSIVVALEPPPNSLVPIHNYSLFTISVDQSHPRSPSPYYGTAR
jgi:hypothetical protein